LQSIVSDSINKQGQYVSDVINESIDTASKNILGEYAFGASGAIQIGTYVNGVSGDIKISPAGILARNTSGAYSLSIDGTTGSVSMVGSISAAAGYIGGWAVTASALYFDGATDAVSSGLSRLDYPFYAGKKFADRATAPFRVSVAGDVTATSIAITGGSIDGTSTIGGRVASTLASAIDSSGHFADSAISTASSQILGAFTFGASGALQIGTYVNGASGDLRISPTGILGRDVNGDTTFSINGTTGVAVLNGLVVGTNVGIGIARQTFTSTPTTPYYVGDLWAAGSSGDLKRCITQRLTGAYQAGDWDLASKYTDDSGVTTIIGNTVTTGFVNALNINAQTLGYGKTSFADSTHAGYWMDSSGLYFGAASDTAYLKYTVGGSLSLVGGTIDGTSTIGGRLSSTLASAIDSSGHFADSAISTATSTIITPFTFGVSGALQIGTYSNGVSGDLKISPSGILARSSSGATTFSIDGTTGVAVLNGLVVGTNVGQGTARQTFVSTPTTPYYVGDLWAAGSSGDLKRCVTQRLTGEYQAGDWDLASKYTDDSGVTTIVGNTVTTSFVNALNVNAASVSASISISSPTITGGTISIGTGDSIFKADSNGIYLGNATFASAPFSVSMAGALTATSATITGALTAGAGSSIGVGYLSGIVGLTNTNISAQGWTNTCVFSATDYRIVAWATGVITTAAGTSYNITGANTGNMSASTSYYIYLDIAVSSTLLQVTTTATTAIGSGKILVATAYANADTTSKAQYQAFGGVGGVRLFVDNISANVASVNEFVSNSAQLANLVVTNAKINDLAVSKLTAGTISSKAIILGVAAGTGDSYLGGGNALDLANWRGGDANGGAFILGLDDSIAGDPARFFIGNYSTGDYLSYDSTDKLKITASSANAITIEHGASILMEHGGDIRFSVVNDAIACTAALVSTSTGNVTAGTHIYCVTYINSHGETGLGADSNTVTTDSTHKQVNLTGIPVSDSPSVTSRNIYRTKAGSPTYYLLANINDNVTTTYTDNTADGSLATPVLKDNTTFGRIVIRTNYVDESAATFGVLNTFLGIRSGNLSNAAAYNTGTGVYSLNSLTTGFYNVGFGSMSLEDTTTGSWNTAVGTGASRTNTEGEKNVAVGYCALFNNATGDRNVSIGVYSLVSQMTGDANVAIGYAAGANSTSSNELFIDNQDRSPQNGDAADDRAKSLIYGVFNADQTLQKLQINANLMIGAGDVRSSTVGTRVFNIFNGTAPVGTLANGISLYSTSGELRVMDAAGNATLLSPHDKKTNEWVYDSVDIDGKRLRIDMEKMMKAINDKFGWDFVKEFTI
jgi:hypothetical protein